MKLLWLDVETSGLDPQKDRLLEVAAFITDLTTPWLREGPVVQCVLPVSELEITAFDPFILDMHTKNDLLADCRKREQEMGPSGIYPKATSTFPARYHEALRSLEALMLLMIPDKALVGRENVTALAGSSVHFDLSFLRHHLPNVAKNLSHRCYDVSAVKLFCRSLGMPKIPPEEAHRALPDVEESMRHARLCAHWIQSGLVDSATDDEQNT